MVCSRVNFTFIRLFNVTWKPSLQFATWATTAQDVHTPKGNCDFLDYYTASSGNFLPAFRDNLSVSVSILDSWTLKMWPMLPRNVGNKCYVITQKSAVVMYFAAEAWKSRMYTHTHAHAHSAMRVYWWKQQLLPWQPVEEMKTLRHNGCYTHRKNTTV